MKWSWRTIWITFQVKMKTTECAKTLKNIRLFNDFHGLDVWILQWKVIKKLSKNKVAIRHTCMMDFGRILDRFGSHFGVQNQSKINQEGKLKSNAKKLASRSAKGVKSRGSDYHPAPRILAWEGGRGKGKPFPEGLKADYPTLNHLSPLGWWDYDRHQRCSH